MTDYPSLQGRGPIALDVETYDPDLKTRGPGAHRDGYIAGIAVAVEGFSAYYPIAHEIGPNLPKAKVLAWLKRELSTDVPKIGANILYDLAFLSAAGINVSGPFWDVQIAEPLLDETLFSYSLENLAQRYLKTGKRSEEMSDWIKSKFKVRKPGNYIWRAPAEIVAPYAIGDVEMPLQIFKMQKAQLKKHDRLWDLFLLESSLIPMLLAMRQRGVRVDVSRAEELFDDMTRRQKRLTRKVGTEFAPWNARDIAKIFDARGVEYPLTEKTKAPSFTKEWLAHHKHPVAKLIHEIRHLDKLRNTFVEGAIINGHYGGRLHCSFNQLRSDDYGAVSGRFSSSNFNLQQIPVRTDDGKLIRSLFLPDVDNDWGDADFNQVEYRLIAHTAAEMHLRGAQDVVDKYNKDSSTDFHQVIAEMTGLPRYQAKTINFACAYGAGVAKICEQLGLDIPAGTKVLNEYHKRAPFIRPLTNALTEEANRDGQIETLLGRVRRFNMWEDKNGQRSKFRTHGARRAFTHAALNAYIQGSAADVLKQAMSDIWSSGVCDVLGPPHLTVHDELCFSVPKNKAGKEAFAEVKHIMETAVEISVPLLVDTGIGKNWGEAK